MTTRLTIDPLTRIEGHLKIGTSIENQQIVDAQVSGQMFRGLEKILLGRHPFDAARMTQRTCGICHEVHGMASILALEQLYGIEAPVNGKRLRELILGLHLVGDHIFHFYQLCLPDYVDFSHINTYRGDDHRVLAVKNWMSYNNNSFFNQQTAGHYLSNKDQSIELALSYFEAMEIRRETGSGMALLGGKVPFIHALMPGGLTTNVTQGKLRSFYQTLQKTTDFVENRYLPNVKLLAEYFSDHFRFGIADAGLLSYRSFSDDGESLFKSGVYLNGARNNFCRSKISEQIDRSFFLENGQPVAQKDSAYSWIKVPHYDGQPMEVGPFARLFINQDAGFKQLLASYQQAELRSSVMSRLLARAYESQLICRHLLRLLEQVRIDKPTITPADLDKPVTGSGSGFSIAARGALSHEIEAVDGKITRYRLLVPSAWNFGPATAKRRGVVESALIGTRVTGENSSLLAGRIVRSFDPCIACAVH